MAIKASDNLAEANALSNYEQKKKNLLYALSHMQEGAIKDISLHKETSNLFRNQPRLLKNKIDVREFNKIIKVDVENLILEVEGMTTYEDIVKETLKHGVLPAVVPELKSITVGGALAGIAIESSSFRYGLVHETIFEYDVLLGNGKIITCRADNEHKDLFYAFPNSYGTLGYALKIKLKLIKTKNYVKLTHMHFTHEEDYFDWMKKLCAENRREGATFTYIDGVVFNSNNMIITLGEFVDKAPYVSDYKYLNIYYKSLLQKRTDYLTTEDYIWRWDSDWFWCSKKFFMQNKMMRFLFGKFLLKSTVFWRLRSFFNKNKIARYGVNLFQGKVETIIQDVDIPITHAVEFLRFFQFSIGIKPIWICPVQSCQEQNSYSFYVMNPHLLYINFGFWDTVPSQKENGHYNRLIEKKVTELNGLKSLYSASYYTMDEFWQIYDQELYQKLKNNYDPAHLLKDIYQKCVQNN